MVTTSKSASNSSFSELEQLRLIIFGEAQQQIEQQITELASQLDEQFTELRQRQEKSNAEIKTLIAEAVEQLSDKVDYVDRQHDENHSKMVAASETLNAQLDIADTSGKEEAEVLHKRIDDEIQTLNTLFSDKHAQAMEKLAQVTHDLTDSKTDRKTLAKLLATMATNLESD